MNGKLPFHFWTWPGVVVMQILVCASAFTVAAQAQPRGVQENLLHFLDGSSLHGSLVTIDSSHLVHWRHPAAREEIAFQPRNLHRLRFMNTAPALPAQTNAPACRLRFANGDEIVGDLLSLDERNIVFKTWFGGELTAPRSSVKTLKFINGRSIVSYEGPGSLAEWNVGQPQGVWSYRDGVLTANAIGSIGRDMGLQPQGRIEFDLAWAGQISLLMSVYTDSTARFDFNSAGYMFILGPGYVTLQRMQGIRGTTHLGQAAVPQLIEKNQARFEIRADKERNTIALFIDGAPIQQWTDSAGFAGQGTGITFLCQRVGPGLNLSNIRVSTWEGIDLESDTATTISATTATTVNLINGDLAKGEVRSIKDGELTLVANDISLPVPLERVLKVNFPAAPTQSKSLAGLVRAELHTGASVTFDIRQWNETEVSGLSPHFGNVTLKPAWIRQLVFNLDKPKPESARSANQDDLFWPFDK